MGPHKDHYFTRQYSRHSLAKIWNTTCIQFENTCKTKLFGFDERKNNHTIPPQKQSLFPDCVTEIMGENAAKRFIGSVRPLGTKALDPRKINSLKTIIGQNPALMEALMGIVCFLYEQQCNRMTLEKVFRQYSE